MTNTELLRKKIEESGLKIRFIAEKIGLTYYGFSKKMNNESEFKVTEVKALCDLLKISDSDMMKIFFTSVVE